MSARASAVWAWLAGAADSQLADAVAANAKLQADLDQLNDTVFSKSFRAPSAWAEREVKYKMDKKAWDTQVSCLSSHIVYLAYQHMLHCSELEHCLQAMCADGCCNLHAYTVLSFNMFELIIFAKP